MEASGSFYPILREGCKSNIFDFWFYLSVFLVVTNSNKIFPPCIYVTVLNLLHD